MPRISRSRFLTAAVASVALFTGAGAGQPRAGRTTLVSAAARPLPLSAIRLTGGPLKRAQELDAKYLVDLEPDRMLAFYRQRAGLVPKAQPYGGWDGDGRNLTGHIAGHYLSAVSLMWAATGDSRFKERADIPENSESRFFDVEYRLPAALVRGKQKVTVRFQSMSGSEIAPVFGLRIIRSAGELR